MLAAAEIGGAVAMPQATPQDTQAAASGLAGKPAFQGIYKGTLGTQAIVLEVGASAVHTDDDRNIEEDEQYPVEGRYFYRRHGVAILLEGRPLADGGLRLKEYVEQKASGAEWKLTFSGNEAKGFFCKCDASQAVPAGMAPLEISLTRVSEGFDPGFTRPEGAQEPPDKAYYDLLLEFPVRTGPEIQVSGGIAYVMQSDPRFKFTMPRLTRFPGKAVMDQINSYLAFQFDNGRLECAAARQGGRFSGGDRDAHATVELLNRDIFSLTVAGSVWQAGAPHPDGFFQVLTYDMRTGGDFDFNTFFLPPAEVPADEDKGDYEFVATSNNLNWELAKLFVQYSGKQQEDCGESVILPRADSLTRYFAKNGMALLSEENMAECGTPVIVPYAALRGLVRKDSPLRYLVERHSTHTM